MRIGLNRVTNLIKIKENNSNLMKKHRKIAHPTTQT